MPLTNLNKGSAPNDGTGTPARDAVDILNVNFSYLIGLINRKVKIGLFWVEKATGNTNLTTFENGDKFDAWLDSDTRYVVGKVIDASALTMPTDIDDGTKVKLAVDNTL